MIYRGVRICSSTNSDQWKSWLKNNAEKEFSTWLIVHHQGDPNDCILYDQAVKEALRYGWIDSKPHNKDSNSYYLFFSRKNPKHFWTKKEKKEILKLKDSNLLTSSAIQLINDSERLGTWDPIDVSKPKSSISF